MAEPQRWALIGDPNPERFDLLRGILEDYFLTTALRVPNYEELRNQLDKRKWNLILVAHDLPQTPAVKIPLLLEFFNHLRFEAYNVTQGCIVGAAEPPELVAVDPSPHRIHIPAVRLSKDQVNRLIAELGSILPLAPHLPDIELQNSPSLREQVRSLSESRSLEEGQKILSHLIRKLFKCNKAHIAQLGQGLSGSKVFRIIPSSDQEEDIKEFILKVSPVSDSWKIELEVERYMYAKKQLGVEGYSIHFPLLVGSRFALESNSHDAPRVIYHERWCAICYDFLGEKKLGKFIDLATVFIIPSADLIEKTRDTPFELPLKGTVGTEQLRLRLFTTALQWLCQNWYMASTPPVRAERKMWETRDTLPKQYPPLPPYRLSGKSKGHVLSFLDSDLATFGERLVESWKNCRANVQELVECRRVTGIEGLDGKLLVRLSPAHGDLNANNLLIWLDKLDHPFLIDFPLYQEAGHALQDFARLEVEVKFGLMDRQLDSAEKELIALDYTFSQMAVWKEMEDHLLSSNWHEPKKEWLAFGFVSNVDSCLKVTQLLRSKAIEVQQQGKTASTPTFNEEYSPALLYHTVRAIGYDSLSIFKRLLAVYSAGQMIAKMKI
jgi:uncharacterized protein associated with vWA-MoxR-VMAP ternary system